MSKTVTSSPRTNKQTEPIVNIRGLYAFRLHLQGHPARSSLNHLSQSNIPTKLSFASNNAVYIMAYTEECIRLSHLILDLLFISHASGLT